MGIKNFTKLLKENNINGKNISIKTLKDSVIAIDTSNFICRFHYGNYNILEGFIQLIEMFLINNIIPVFIFDGKTPLEKKEEKEKRKERMKQNKENITEKINNSEVIDFKSIDKLNKLNNFPVKIFSKLKDLFKLLDVTFIVADEEADDICKLFSEYKLVDYVLSEDRDFIISNENTLNSLDLNKQTFILWNRTNIIKNLKLKNKNSLIDLGILLGCDYTEKIPGVGYKTSYKLILKYDSIKNILNDKKNKKLDTSKFFWEDAQKRFKTFDTDKLLIYNNQYTFYINYEKINKKELSQFTMKNKIDKRKIKSLLKTIENNYNYIKDSLLYYYL